MVVGLAGAPSGALAALGMLDPELGARFRATERALPVGEALSAAVRAVAQERPVLLALDDAHWLDAASLATLPALARDSARRPVMLLCGVGRGAPESARLDDLRARLGRDLEGAVIRLGRLDAATLSALAAWALPSYGADEAARLVRRVERDTAGIALLVVALLEAVAEGFKLAPFIGIGCPGVIEPDGTIDRGAQNLPGNWASKGFNLPAAILGAIPTIGKHETTVLMQNDAVVQGLSQLPWMRDVKRWGVLTIGTGLGNARFTNRNGASQ